MNNRTENLYAQYLEITQKAADIQYASAVLGWDQEVYMPSKGFSFRGRQLATLAAMAHELLTSDSYGKLLEELAIADDLLDEQKRNVTLSLEDYTKNKKLPGKFVEKITQQISNSYSAWIAARDKNDFGIYAPELEKMIELKKQQAAYYGFEHHPYNALLDDYEKGATVAMLDTVFESVKEQLPPFLEKVKAAPQVQDDFFYQHFPRQQQWDFSIEILKAIGYDMEAGRQDLSEHPFTTSFSPQDVRVTTRVEEKDFASLLWSTIHEGGHALYEQGLPVEHYGLPLGAAASLAIHESQSRLWENCVGRSLPFWRKYYPLLKEYFPSQLEHIPVEDFYKGMNKVMSSFVRTESDEVTYHFHVLIRYEIEKQLIDGSLSVADLPEKWNDLYENYLGIRPTTDKEGVLQDVHWCHGSFGYFPTYSLGSFYAAQFFDQAKKDIPALEGKIEQGDFEDLLSWLRNKIHRFGRSYTSEELCTHITGKGLDFSSFIQYLQHKYNGIYELEG